MPTNTNIRMRPIGRCSIAALAAVVTVFALGAASALADGGGAIASAPELPIGQQISGGSTGDQAKNEFWRITLQRGDHLRIDYGSTNGMDVPICLLAPDVTDYTISDANCEAQDDTTTKHELRYIAPMAGGYTLLVGDGANSIGANCCYDDLAYALTAYVQHPTHATLTGPSVARAHSLVTLSGKVDGLSSGNVAIQLRSKAGWKTLSLLPVGLDGSFRLNTRLGAARSYRFRAVFYGDASHLATSANYSIHVV